MSLESFVINFWVTYKDEKAQVKFNTIPPVPSSTDVTETTSNKIDENTTINAPNTFANAPKTDVKAPPNLEPADSAPDFIWFPILS